VTDPTWDTRRFATLPSTNDWLIASAREGARAGTVVVADFQSEGRGRLGRRWEAPRGRCLLASVLLRPLAEPGRLYACTAAVALALADACCALAGVDPELKWPNDLLVEGRKLAGVLAESDPRAPGGRPGSVAVVVGVGCNIDWEEAPGATCLAAHAAAPPRRDALLDAWLDALAPRASLLDADAGRRAIVGQLKERCVTLGQRVQVQRAGGDSPLVGLATGIEDDGRLVVAPDDGAGTVAVSVGDVVHLRPIARCSR
jgi:BirA family biotin operon repressor/biotin-[acetyl-CoA-carboxylase] ligase